MKKLLFVSLALALVASGCASTGGAKFSGNTVGSALRAPVDFVSGVGSGIAGSRFSAHRPFNPDWEKQKSDPIFWEDDEAFFSSR